MEQISQIIGADIDDFFDDRARIKRKLDSILRQVERPGRYVSRQR